MNTCRGITLRGNKCSRRIKTGKQEYCHLHSSCKYYIQEKPVECPICCESLTKQQRALSCGHWVHLECIVQSAKAECPLCRASLQLGSQATRRIKKLARQRHLETLAEEEEELREDIETILSPDLQERIQDALVEHLLINNHEDAEAIISELFTEDCTEFISSLLGYEILQSQYSDEESEEWSDDE